MSILNSGIGNYIFYGGKRFSYFGGNNYLGLAGHPAVKEAAIKAIEKYGASFSASRRTTGTADLHLELEKKLAGFKNADDAVVFASGYMGNGILLETLKDSFSSVFIDNLAHPSIIEGIPPAVSDIHYYRHCDTEHLGELLSASGSAGNLVITDGIFALTGEIAPLDRIFRLTRSHNASLLVDDAHATGILGPTGKGTPEHFGIHGSADVFQSETMSKALGSFGGFIAGSNALTASIRDNSKGYQGSTSLPPPVAAASIASLDIISTMPHLRARLLEKAAMMRKEIAALGFRTTDFNTPIIPVILDTGELAAGLSSFLEENGIIVPFMNYPVKQELFLLRIAVSTVHETGQIAQLLEKLKLWKKRYGKD